MKGRAIKDLAQLTDAELFESIAVGLNLVVKNVERLIAASDLLQESKQFHVARVLATLAEEEAAKFLILLDAVRCPRAPEERFSDQLRRFEDHMAKGIYSRTCGMCPNDLAQMQEYIDLHRDEFYLDGPNGVDWVFPNEIRHKRDSALYVDYVDGDDRHYWSDPAQFEDFLGSVSEPWSVRTARFLFNVGVSTREALAVVAEIWRPLILDPGTSWWTVRAYSQRTLEELKRRGLLTEHADYVYSWIVEKWQFPLYDLDLTLKKVAQEDLHERQRNWTPD